MEPLPIHNRSRWGETERMELSPTTRRRQFSSAITAPAKTILAMMALFRVSLEPLRVQPLSALFIITNLVLMLAAVHFNYQPPLKADEIYDIATERLLPSEFELIKSPPSEYAPQAPLCIGQVSPKPSGS